MLEPRSRNVEHVERSFSMSISVRNTDDTNTESARWDPFTDLQRVHDQLSRLFGGDALAADEFTPLADVEETDDAYMIELELPGVSKHDIDISLSGRRLTITGERKEKERVGVLRRRTRTIGRFRYEIVLPGPVDDDGVTASLDDGVLSVTVPKASTERPRRISVK
jgi:HSP20 family protein